MNVGRAARRLAESLLSHAPVVGRERWGEINRGSEFNAPEPWLNYPDSVQRNGQGHFDCVLFVCARPTRHILHSLVRRSRANITELGARSSEMDGIRTKCIGRKRDDILSLGGFRTAHTPYTHLKRADLNDLVTVCIAGINVYSIRVSVIYGYRFANTGVLVHWARRNIWIDVWRSSK